MFGKRNGGGDGELKQITRPEPAAPAEGPQAPAATAPQAPVAKVPEPVRETPVAATPAPPPPPAAVEKAAPRRSEEYYDVNTTVFNALIAWPKFFSKAAIRLRSWSPRGTA